MPSRSDRRSSTARSRRPRDRSAGRSRTFSRLATKRRRWRHDAARRRRAVARADEANDTATSADALDRLLRGDYRDPDGGAPIARADQGRAHRAQPPGHRGGSRGAARARTPAWPSSAIPPRAPCSARRVERALVSTRRRSCRSCSNAQPHADRANRGDAPARVRLGRRARRGRVRNHQRPLQIRGSEGWQAVRRVRHRAVDERLHVDERRDHGRRAQEDAAGRDAAGGVHGSRRFWRRRRRG